MPPKSDQASSPSVADETSVRRACKQKREATAHEERRRRRKLLPQHYRAPPTSEEVLRENITPGQVFDKIPHSALHKSRKAYLATFTAFNHATPRDCTAEFTNESAVEGKEQL